MRFKNQSYRNCSYTKALDDKNNIPFKKTN